MILTDHNQPVGAEYGVQTDYADAGKAATCREHGQPTIDYRNQMIARLSPQEILIVGIGTFRLTPMQRAELAEYVETLGREGRAELAAIRDEAGRPTLRRAKPMAAA